MPASCLTSLPTEMIQKIECLDEALREPSMEAVQSRHLSQQDEDTRLVVEVTADLEIVVKDAERSRKVMRFAEKSRFLYLDDPRYNPDCQNVTVRSLLLTATHISDVIENGELFTIDKEVDSLLNGIHEFPPEIVIGGVTSKHPKLMMVLDFLAENHKPQSVVVASL
ncbi:hypothetical protein QR680_010527 [Steinernema hermaphroditum]|uniref:Uncharacterized protein n=1 Tax=Steinernema hermaphroditum TaxID=289476 RepID=A0AA39MAW1_9BILA|nr:hypothetical protein QR680_010527 [Steinernema hermaphroditum]